MNKEQLTLGSLFDGIGGFPYAASFYGIRPLWASEIIPECISVTQKHFPEMEHVGDITKLYGGTLPPVDIITFGSPARTCPWRRASAWALPGNGAASFWRLSGLSEKCRRQPMENTRNSRSGKMSPEPCQVLPGVTLRLCWKRSQRPKFQCLVLDGGQTPEWYEAEELTSLGACTTLNNV